MGAIKPINRITGDTAHNSGGRHSRLLVFGFPCGAENEFAVREDTADGLPRATMRDLRRALNGWQRLHPRGVRLRYVGSSEPYGPYASIEHTFRPV